MSGFLPTVAYFVVQISDFQNFFQISEHHILDCHLYADDTTIFTDNKSLSNINLKLQSDLTNVRTWSESNGLSVNPKKSVQLMLHKAKKSMLTEIHTKFELRRH